MVASQAHRLLLPWKLQAHLDNINYPSDFNQPSQCKQAKARLSLQNTDARKVSDQQEA